MVLISAEMACSFDVIYSTRPFKFLTGPICTLIALNMFTHYYLVFCPQPPKTFPDHLLWALHERPTDGYAYRAFSSLENGLRGDERAGSLNITEITKCRKWGKMRPERAHHCRICNRCAMKYDHHSPVSLFSRMNQCVGVYNERHFVMFMMYVCLSTALCVLLGYQQFLNALGLSFQVHFRAISCPVIAYLLTFILSCVLCFAVGIMLIVALWSVMKGETSVEAQDHEIYMKVALSRGEAFINSYDLGKTQNLKLFFNMGEGGYPIYTLFIPFRILPYTDGRSWARRDGFERHHGVSRGEELTDDEIDENDL
ncbi:zf-DHHC-domain-containing protein [Dendrothele bispora CBS 962.96]|uniref:Palmitoyltransferase n=1 Tax=Dendrothele bispora (strain CBS 962.96) TaxID=1314807 RepID=A0A4S8M3X1_DENBC|nr:zf-DHHC-domain-containing protein [Dendrothele bispora CBS 962.96]